MFKNKKQKNIAEKMILMNILVMKKHHILISSLVLTLFVLLMTYFYFLSMSVFYQYSINSNTNELRKESLSLAKIQTELFKKEKDIEKTILATNYTSIDNIDYVRRGGDVLVYNYIK